MHDKIIKKHTEDVGPRSMNEQKATASRENKRVAFHSSDGFDESCWRVCRRGRKRTSQNYAITRPRKYENMRDAGSQLHLNVYTPGGRLGWDEDQARTPATPRRTGRRAAPCTGTARSASGGWTPPSRGPARKKEAVQQKAGEGWRDWVRGRINKFRFGFKQQQKQHNQSSQ